MLIFQRNYARISILGFRVFGTRFQGLEILGFRVFRGQFQGLGLRVFSNRFQNLKRVFRARFQISKRVFRARFFIFCSKTLKFIPKSCFFTKIPLQNQFFFYQNLDFDLGWRPMKLSNSSFNTGPPGVEEKFEKYFGYLHEPWERMRWQKPFCRVTLSRFWMSELIFCRALPDLRIF